MLIDRRPGLLQIAREGTDKRNTANSLIAIACAPTTILRRFLALALLHPYSVVPHGDGGKVCVQPTRHPAFCKPWCPSRGSAFPFRADRTCLQAPRSRGTIA